MGKREPKEDSVRTLRDVSVLHALLCLAVLLLPLYYAVFSQETIRPGIEPASPSPTGAMSAITGAAVSGEPACPTFPAGAGIGGGCRLIGTTGSLATVPPECMGSAGCTLRIISSVPLSSVYAGADIVNGMARRISEITYSQDSTTNIVSLGSSYAIGTTTTLSGVGYPSSTIPYSFHNYYMVDASAAPGQVPSLWGGNVGGTVLQGGSAVMDSVRFRTPASYSGFTGYTVSEVPCQLSIDSAVEADPTKFTVLTVPFAWPAASACELYVCT